VLGYYNLHLLFFSNILIIHQWFLAIGKKSGINEADILILPVDITNLELHQQYFDAVIKHFGKVSKNFTPLDEFVIKNLLKNMNSSWTS